MINDLDLWYHNNTLKGKKSYLKKMLKHTFIELAGGNMQDTSNHSYMIAI